MVGVLTAMLLAALDQTIVSTALPRIVQELHGLDRLTWVVTAYLLTSTITVPIYGKLSDQYGRRAFLIAAVLIFLLGSVLSGQSQTMTQLIVFRGLQGIGGGAIMANAFAIIGDLFTPAERGRWQGVVGGVFGLASIVGPALGGFLTDHGSWRWTFYVNVPVGIVALALLIFLLPTILPAEGKPKIDYLGAGLLASGLVALLLGCIWGGSRYDWFDPREYVILDLSAFLLLMFGLAEQRAAQPILPLDLFKNKTFSLSMAAVFLAGVAMFGAILYIPLFAQNVLGVSATSSGTILTPLMLGLVAASALSGQLTSRTGRYKIQASVGMAIVTGSLLWMSLITQTVIRTELIMRMILLGIGLGITMPIFNLAVQNAFSRKYLGVVSASTQLFRSIGGTVGVAVLGSVLNQKLRTNASELLNNPATQPDASFIAAQLHRPTFDSIALQNFLNPQLQPLLVSTNKGMDAFLLAAKSAYTGAVTEVFLVASILTGAAFVLTLFLPDIALQRSESPLEQVAEGVEEGTSQPVMSA